MEGPAIERLRDEDWVYELDDEQLTVDQRARKLIAAWADEAGDWERGMRAFLDSHQPALVPAHRFDGACRRCADVRVQPVSSGREWRCPACEWRVEIIDLTDT